MIYPHKDHYGDFAEFLELTGFSKKAINIIQNFLDQGFSFASIEGGNVVLTRAYILAMDAGHVHCGTNEVIVRPGGSHAIKMELPVPKPKGALH